MSGEFKNNSLSGEKKIVMSDVDIGKMEEAHIVFLPIPDTITKQEFIEENLPDDCQLVAEDVSPVVIKEEVSVEESKNDQCVEQIVMSDVDIGKMEEAHTVFLPIPDTVIKQEFIEENLPDDCQLVAEDVSPVVIKEKVSVEESKNDQCVEQGYLFTSVNNMSAEVDPTVECELYRRKSIHNQPVFSALHVLLNCSTVVCENKNCQCGFCTKSYTSKDHLSPHKLIHSGIKKYQCDVCTKSFTRSYDLSQHKLIHSAIKKYQCDVCSKSFTVSKYLLQHKLVHSSIKKYQCDVCSKSFIWSGALSQHKLTHSAIQKYQCDICSKSFTRSGDLSKHKLIHSDNKKSPSVMFVQNHLLGQAICHKS